MFARFCKTSIRFYQTSMKFYGASTCFAWKRLAGYKPYHYHGPGLFTFGSTLTEQHQGEPSEVDRHALGRYTVGRITSREGEQ